MLDNTDDVQDAFIFCPNLCTVKMDKILEQGIFISKTDMSKKKETKISIHNKFTTLTFEENVSRNSKLQTVKDYLMDVVNNEKESSSSLLSAFFSLF